MIIIRLVTSIACTADLQSRESDFHSYDAPIRAPYSSSSCISLLVSEFDQFSRGFPLASSPDRAAALLDRRSSVSARATAGERLSPYLERRNIWTKLSLPDSTTKIILLGAVTAFSVELCPEKAINLPAAVVVAAANALKILAIRGEFKSCFYAVFLSHNWLGIFLSAKPLLGFPLEQESARSIPL